LLVGRFLSQRHKDRVAVLLDARLSSIHPLPPLLDRRRPPGLTRRSGRERRRSPSRTRLPRDYEVRLRHKEAGKDPDPREETMTANLAYDRNNAQLYVGDCVEVMAALPAESVDSIVTSPPYAMQRKSTYGGIPEAEYPAWTVAWMAEARRVLKPDGSVLLNIRPHIKAGQLADYTLRTRLALRESGWAEVDEIVWFKRSSPPTGSPRK